MEPIVPENIYIALFMRQAPDYKTAKMAICPCECVFVGVRLPTLAFTFAFAFANAPLLQDLQLRKHLPYLALTPGQ